MRRCQTSNSCIHSWNKQKLMNLGNFKSNETFLQGYYALFVDNFPSIAIEIPAFKILVRKSS
jgi:hypothetical protein